jgi:microsomal dipeptidase-like Zn-dependent dipeptidase
VCAPTEANVVAAIRHAVAVVGADHVGLGSDFDGATRTPWDTRALARITGALLEAGMPEAEIRLVMGESVRRLLEATLPAATR